MRTVVRFTAALLVTGALTLAGPGVANADASTDQRIGGTCILCWPGWE